MDIENKRKATEYTNPSIIFKSKNKMDLGDDFVAPDGGWGWLVAYAAGINILLILALSSQFGIIFREHFLTLGMSNSQLLTIISSQSAISYFTGLGNAPLFRRYTFRQVALGSAFFNILGHILLVYADAFWSFFVAYSLLCGLGRGWAFSATSLAVNTYFKQKRRAAISLQFGVVGLGSIFLPLFATWLLQVFGVRGTVLIFAGLVLHMVPCALIFQPVMWHVKIWSEFQEVDNLKQTHVDSHTHPVEQLQEPKERAPLLRRTIKFFDFDLLRDITFVNLIFGLIIIDFVEINFAILTPFILADFAFGIDEIAFAMSLLGVCDFSTRFLIPLITAYFHRVSNKYFFIIGIVGMCLGRFMLVYTTEFYTLLAILVWIGLCKGFRTVFWALIIPSYVPLKRLPGADGLKQLLSGFFYVSMGPLIGLLRDSTNYAVMLHVFNAMCLIALALWLLEDGLRKYMLRPI